MKLSIYLKLALFAFLCSIVCTIGYVLTEIELIAVLINWLWLGTYAFLVIWICTKIYKKVRYSISWIFVVASFAIALYLGVQLSVYDCWSQINDFENITTLPFLFIVFTIVCLFFIMILIGRLIFGNSQNSTNEMTETSPVRQKTWHCNCGVNNVGNFCSNCGSKMPEESTQSPNP